MTDISIVNISLTRTLSSPIFNIQFDFGLSRILLVAGYCSNPDKIDVIASDGKINQGTMFYILTSDCLSEDEEIKQSFENFINPSNDPTRLKYFTLDQLLSIDKNLLDRLSIHPRRLPSIN